MSDPQIPTPAPYRRPPQQQQQQQLDTNMADTELMLRQKLAPETAVQQQQQQWVSLRFCSLL